MADAFTITTTSGSIDLDQLRQGSANFSVTNVSGQPVRARALPVADGPAQPAWFAVADGAERNFPVGGTEQYVVQVTAPATAAPGSYRFRLDVLGTDNPDEVQAHGEWVSFQVAAQPKPPPPRIPWLWIIIAAAAVVVVAAVAVTAWVLTHRQGTLTPTPSTVSFGTVAVGGRIGMPVTVRNTGPAATGVKASIAGTNANQFSLVPGGCAATLQPNATCVVGVLFAPTVKGTFAGVLQLTADNAATQSVSLTGTGGVPLVSAPDITLMPVSTDFGQRYTGAGKVTNTGTVDLHVRKVSFQTGTSLTATPQDFCSGQTVPPRGSCEFTFTLFYPETNALFIESDAPGSPFAVRYHYP